jgi:dephospho-CoA kinase
LGLVGGVGSGKSHVAAGLAAKRNIAVISADPIGHAVLRRSAVKSRLRDLWGDSVFSPNGEIDRVRVGSLVFGEDPAARDRRRQLEAITHPEITSEVRRQIDEFQAQPGLEAIVLDAALLLEAGWRSFCDLVVFVDSPLSDRQRRVADSRGWSAEELARREASQWPLERKLSASDGVIENTGPDLAVRQLDELLARWQRETGRRSTGESGGLREPSGTVAAEHAPHGPPPSGGAGGFHRHAP